MDLRYQQRFAEKDRRDNQRFEASQQALAAALSAQETAVQAAMTAAEKAVNKAEIAAEKRFEGVNEFRAQLNDYQKMLLPRIEYNAAHQSLAEKIADLSSRVDKTEGSAKGGHQVWGYVAGAAGIVIAVVALFFK
jgi:hypothetical protein